MPSFTWKIVRNVRAREGCRNYLELTESVFYYCKTAAGKLATMISPWSFPWRRLIKRSNTATFKLTKIFAVIRLISQILIEFLLAKENFLPWNEKPYCFGRSAIKLSSELMLTEAIFYQPGTFFFILSEQGKSENLHTVLVVMWFVEVVFLLPLTITVDSTFVAGHATRNTATELLFYVLRAAGAKDVTQEHQRISWGQPEGLCRKEKWPRKHTWAEALRAILKWDSLTTVGNC